ncbi:MAG: diadenylate cyclase CdaA [Muribaculum sp.]|nr:diadenylate cyclase CdaA [Muribaculaceae bacterium]MCM1080583.1 diadenylate cyclase CdaA [Muribaculum sp.]
MIHFGIKDALDILLVALMLYYLYKIMKESATINIFFGVLAFIVVWVLASEVFEMRLIGTIMDKVMSIGLIILVILFQDQIKRFLVELGNHNRWLFLSRLFSHHHNGKKGDQAEVRKSLLAIVRACMSMSKSKTGALIVIEQSMPLEQYEISGDMIDANINTRLIENIFFKNSPLHDGALIIAHGHIKAAGCILPVSHDTKIPRYMGLRHRSALGISQASDAAAVVVSEETGNISFAYKGKIEARLSSTDLEKKLSQLEYI